VWFVCVCVCVWLCVCVCVWLCDIETSTIRRPGPDWGCCSIEKEIKRAVCHRGNKTGWVRLISRKYFELRRWKEGGQNCVTSSFVEASWNVMAHGDAREGKWRGNWRMERVASTLHTTSEHGVSSITTADAHTSAASSRLN